MNKPFVKFKMRYTYNKYSTYNFYICPAELQNIIDPAFTTWYEHSKMFEWPKNGVQR